MTNISRQLKSKRFVDLKSDCSWDISSFTGRTWLIEELKDELEDIGYRIIFNEFDSSTELITAKIIDRVNKYKQQTKSEASIQISEYIDSEKIDKFITQIEQITNRKPFESEDTIVDIEEILEFKMKNIPGLDRLNYSNNITMKFLSRYILTATTEQYEILKKYNKEIGFKISRTKEYLYLFWNKLRIDILLNTNRK